MPQVCILFECLSLVSSYVGGSVFFSCPHHFRGFITCGLSYVHFTRSQPQPITNTGHNPDDKAEVPKENPVVPTEVVPSGHVELPEAPAEGEVKEGTGCSGYTS